MAPSSPCGRRSSRPIAPSGYRSARGTSGSSRPFRLADPVDAPGPPRGVARRVSGGPPDHARSPPASRLHHPPGRDLRAHRRGAPPHLRRDARRQLRPRRVPHAGHVSRLLGVRAAPSRPLRDARAVAPAHLRLWMAELPHGGAAGHPRVAQRPDLHARRAVDRAAERGPGPVERRLAVRAHRLLHGRRAPGERGAQPRPARRVRRRRALHGRALRLHALVVHGQGHAGDRPGQGRRLAHGDRHGPCLRPHLGGRGHLRGGGRRAPRADLPRLSHGRAPVRAHRLRRRRPGRARRHGGRADRQPDRRRRRGRRLVRDRDGVEGSAVPAPVHRDPRDPPRGALRPARRRGDRHVKGTWPAVVFFSIAALGPVVVSDPFLLDGLILILLWGATAAAWNVAGGYAGQVSLGHAAFFGLGAYSAALLGTRWGLSPWIGLLVGAALATAFGILIGFLSNRLRGPYFVLATIAFSQVLLIVASRWRGFTAGSEGIPVPFRPGFWTLGITDKRLWVAIVLALAICVYLLELYLERSRRGYQLAAVREDEDAALSLGVPALGLKVAAIAASAALTAVCGALWAQYVGFVDPFYVFSVDLSVRFALAAILGGIGTALGPFIGAALILTLETYLRARFGGIGASLVEIYLIIYGTALVVMMRFAPQGLVPWIGERLRRRPVAGSGS